MAFSGFNYVTLSVIVAVVVVKSSDIDHDHDHDDDHLPVTVPFYSMKDISSGFISRQVFSHGFFSASIKLPSAYTAGVVDWWPSIFYVDNVVIRKVTRTESMGGDFPSKPMSVYATIWDGSGWATDGGKYRVDYKYAPFIAKFSDFNLHGCTVDPTDITPTSCDNIKGFESITRMQSDKMESFRVKHMTYSYCYDINRYQTAPPECIINPQEADSLKAVDPVKFGGARRRHSKRQRSIPRSTADSD
ncbi:hypothetical protein ACFE04_030498 [Oxalis oulophora]